MAALENLSALITGSSRLLEEHLKLARLELKADAREIGARLGAIAALMPILVVGYGFLCGALALWLGKMMALEGAFALVGAVNLVGAALGIRAAAQALKGKGVMQTTMAELEATSVAVRGGPEREGGA